jgi:iron complex outermembrane recepter protein
MKSSRLIWGVACLWAVARTASAADTSGGSSTENSSVATLQEVVVTAQKREERLEDVPISMNVLQGEDLTTRSLTQLTDYADYLPGVNVTDNGTPGFTAIAIRGVTNFGATNTVGTYIDDVPVGSSAGWAFASATQLDLPPYDLERIEVLRGPQGTLYGAGSTGGQLKYVLTSPSTDQFQLKGGADAFWVDQGDQLGTRFRAEMNAPISSNLALLVSGFYAKTPGWVDNTYGGETQKDVNSYKESGARVALLWKPAEDLSVKLNALGFWTYADGLDWVVFNKVTPVPNSGDVNLVTISDPVGKNTQSFAFPQPVNRTFNLYSATIEWNPGPVAVTSATSWSKESLGVTRDFSIVFGPLYPLFDPTVPAGLNSFEDLEDLHKFTQELRFASPQNQTLEWLVGLFYTAEKSQLNEYSSAYSNAYEPIPQFQPYFFTAAIPSTYDERAVFGDLTWHISHSFDLIGGIRYSHNDQSVVAYEGGTLAGGSVTVQPPDSSASDTTWSGSARYHITPDLCPRSHGIQPGRSKPSPADR